MDACIKCVHKNYCISVNKSASFIADHCTEKEVLDGYEQMEMERQAEIDALNDALNDAYVAENYDFDRGDWKY